MNTLNTQRSFKTAGLLALALSGMAGQAQAAQVLLNGQPLATSVAPLQRQGRTLVPMRDIFEALGAKVQWNNLTRGISAQRANTTVQMQIGNREAQLNGQPVRLEQPPLLYNGSTLVPLRFVSEALGARVDWNNAAQTVTISTNGAAPSTMGSGSQVAGARTISVPADVVVPVTLDTALSSATAHVGDSFTATVKSQRMGDSEFPAGTKLEGVVSEARPHNGDDPGVLDLDFRTVVLPDGNRAPLRGQLISLDEKNLDHQGNGRLVAKGKKSDRAKIIGIGAAGGYVIGHLLFKKNGILSAGLGALGGYLYDKKKEKGKAREALLPQGAEFGVRLDSPVSYADTTNYAEKRASYKL